MALITVVLACLVLTLAAHALLLLARTEAVITQLEARRVEAGYEARAALLDAAAALDSLPPSGRLAAPPGVELRVHRPSPELAVLEAGSDGREAAGAGSHAMILYAPDPVTRATRRRGALRTGRLRRAPASRVEWEGRVCAASLGARPLPVSAPVPDSAAGGVPFPGIGGLDLSILAQVLPAVPPGRLDVRVELDGGGRCLPGPGNWGDPARPGGPCAARHQAGAVRGDLLLSGEGQGLLVVHGDLTLTRDSHFRGWLLVTGRLHVEPGGRLSGVADAAGGTVLDAGATLVPDRCGAAEALDSATRLRRPRGIGPPAWPVFPS